MPSPQSLRRLANLTKKVRDDMRTGGMAVNFRYLFRSTAILARVVEILADHVATEAEERQAQEAEAGTGDATAGDAPAGDATAGDAPAGDAPAGAPSEERDPA